MKLQQHKTLKRIIKVFGPEDGAFILMKAATKIKSSEIPIFTGVKSFSDLQKEVESISLHISRFSLYTKIMGVGPRSSYLGMSNADSWIVPQNLSSDEVQVLRLTFQGELVLPGDFGVRIFNPIPVIVNPIGVNIPNGYVYLHKGLEAILTLLKTAGFPLYLLFSSAKYWFPFDIMSDDEISCLPFDFFGFNKLITKMGFLDICQISYLKEDEEDIEIC